jgi:hypothetical protein
MMRMPILIGVILGIILTSNLLNAVDTKNMEKFDFDLANRFIDSFQVFIEENKLTAQEGQQLLSTIVMNSPTTWHGGLAKINDNVYVENSSANNVLRTPNGVWTKEIGGKPQVVILVDDKVVGEIILDKGIDLCNLRMVYFGETAIHVTNFGEMHGSYLKRLEKNQ